LRGVGGVAGGRGGGARPSLIEPLAA
jgi:hypothetical protein